MWRNQRMSQHGRSNAARERVRCSEERKMSWLAGVSTLPRLTLCRFRPTALGSRPLLGPARSRFPVAGRTSFDKQLIPPPAPRHPRSTSRPASCRHEALVTLSPCDPGPCDPSPCDACDSHWPANSTTQQGLPSPLTPVTPNPCDPQPL